MTGSTITAAAIATARVQGHVEQALALLGEFDTGAVNTLGVYTDPWRQRTALTAAREAIDAALAVMSETAWPTDADYDEPA